MKLSFSTKGWHQNSFEEFCNVAVELGFRGIEPHNIHNRLFTDRDGAFHDYTAAATRRKLLEKKLEIPCLDAVCDLSEEDAAGDNLGELRACLTIAANLRIPYVRVRARMTDDTERAENAVRAVLDAILKHDISNRMFRVSSTSSREGARVPPG